MSVTLKNVMQGEADVYVDGVYVGRVVRTSFSFAGIKERGWHGYNAIGKPVTKYASPKREWAASEVAKRAI